MVAANLTLLGAKALQVSLARMRRDYNKALGMALTSEAWDIMNVALELVPKKKSILEGTGTVADVKKDSAGDPYVELGFGTKYALPVHEMPESNNFTTPGTGPKYLERPFNAQMKGWKKRVAMNTRFHALRMSKGLV